MDYDVGDLVRLLERHEGRRKHAYVDTAGRTTIGVGRNLTDRGLDDGEIDAMLERDIEIAEVDIKEHLPWYKELSPMRQMVLVDMCFNLGWGGLKKFEKFLAALQEHDYEKAAIEMLASKWADQVGNRAQELAFMMRNDHFPKEVP